MKTTRGKQAKDPTTGTEQVSRGSEIKSLVAYAAGLVQQLESAMSQLPHVDSHGYSPCPGDILQQLYGRKEELEQQVASCIPTLNEILSVLEKEVARCEANLDRIRADAGRVHLTETQDKYSQAEQAQELELRQARDERDAVYMVLKKAELALQISRGRQIPPIRWKDRDESSDGTGKDKDVSSAGSPDRGKMSLGGELDGLISLGPRGRP